MMEEADFNPADSLQGTSKPPRVDRPWIYNDDYETNRKFLESFSAANSPVPKPPVVLKAQHFDIDLGMLVSGEAKTNGVESIFDFKGINISPTDTKEYTFTMVAVGIYPATGEVDKNSHSIGTSEIRAAIDASGVSGDKEVNIVIEEDPNDPSKINIKVEEGGATKTYDEEDDPKIVPKPTDKEAENFDGPYMIGDPPASSFGEYPGMACLSAVNAKHSQVVNYCYTTYGPLTVEAENYPAIARCLRADAGYRASADACGDLLDAVSPPEPVESSSTIAPWNSPPPLPATYTDKTKLYNCLYDATPGIKAMQSACAAKKSPLEDSSAYVACLEATPGYLMAYDGLNADCTIQAQRK